jgi:hypothetical protein
MTDDQLYVLLASYEQKVSHHEDRALFAEAVRAAKASALRAAYFTLWLCCVTSLQRRLSDRAKHEPLVDPLLVELGSTAATQTPAIALLLEQAQKHDLLLDAGAAKLQRLDAMQQACRDAKAAAPPLADFVADAFAVVDSVLCRAGRLECGSGLEQALVLSRAITAVVDTLRQHLTASQAVKPS